MENKLLTYTSILGLISITIIAINVYQQEKREREIEEQFIRVTEQSYRMHQQANEMFAKTDSLILRIQENKKELDRLKSGE